MLGRRGLIGVALLCAPFARPQDKLITFHVVAVDSRGQPVSDLTAADFQVEDQGKHFRIAVFHKDGAPVDTDPPLSPDEYSNHPASPPAAVTVILLDLLNPIDPRLGRDQLAAAMQKTPLDNVFLYFLTTHGPLAARSLPPDPDPPVSLAAINLEGAYQTARVFNTDPPGEDYAYITYRSFQLLVSRLAGFPGRKSILWISRGIPFATAQASYPAMVADLNAKLQRWNIAVYPVGNSDQEPGHRSTGTLEEVALMTGGRAHLDGNVPLALREALGDAQPTYAIGYYPEPWDDKYHKVRLVCIRHGVRILARDGYYAHPEQASTVEQEKNAIQMVAWSPFDVGEIGMRVSTTGDPDKPRQRHFKIRLAMPDLRLWRREEGYAGSFSITFVSYDVSGKQSISKPLPYSFHMTAEQHESAVKGGISAPADQVVEESTKKIRVIVFDRNSNAVGSVTIPVAAGAVR
jgi:VWFA-related protein